MMAGVPRVKYLLNFSMYGILIFWWCLQMTKYLLAICTLLFCPAFCSQDMNIYLVFPTFTSRPTSFPATSNASVVFLYGMYVFAQ